MSFVSAFITVVFFSTSPNHFNMHIFITFSCIFNICIFGDTLNVAEKSTVQDTGLRSLHDLPIPQVQTRSWNTFVYQFLEWLQEDKDPLYNVAEEAI